MITFEELEEGCLYMVVLEWDGGGSIRFRSTLMEKEADTLTLRFENGVKITGYRAFKSSSMRKVT